jgi:hypothetical protein
MKLQRKIILGVAIVASVGIGSAMILRRSNSAQPARELNSGPSLASTILDHPTVDLSNYKHAVRKVENDRVALWLRYQEATTTAKRESIIGRGRELLARSISDEISPYWYGTGWDFYGTTETPGKGKIACGYFVTTVLRDVGVKVQRVRLAQQASENIILSLTTNDHTKRFRQIPIDRFVDVVKKWGTGLYVVGLDVHVGFILNVAGEVYFVHSSYADPYCVVRERASESRILTSSRYRVLGKLSEDDDFILKWLRGDQFTTRVA